MKILLKQKLHIKATPRIRCPCSSQNWKAKIHDADNKNVIVALESETPPYTHAAFRLLFDLYIVIVYNESQRPLGRWKTTIIEYRFCDTEELRYSSDNTESLEMRTRQQRERQNKIHP